MKILLVHPQFEFIGGAEKVAVKFLEIIAKDFGFQVDVLSFGKFNFAMINKQTGIKLNEKLIKHIELAISPYFDSKLSRFRIAILHRKAKAIASDYDKVISTYNEIDTGPMVALQYVHHPMLIKELDIIEYHLSPRKRKSFLLLNFYRYLSNLIANRSVENISSNLTACNSLFIRKIFEDIYKASSTVIYPSIIESNFKPKQKKTQILSISRFSAHKNVNALIEVFDNINALYPKFDFIIAGHLENETYFNDLNKLILKKNYNIQLLPNCSREKILELYSESSFYINPKHYEHFGIAVLEAMYFECLPIVHSSGGSIELVPFKELQFQNFHEIPELIKRIESENGTKKKLHDNIRNQINNFTLEKFEREVKEFLKLYFELN